jgi:hypothetical protein
MSGRPHRRPRSPRPPARRLAAALVAALLFAAGACGGHAGRRSKAAAPAVWSDAGVLAATSLADLDRLRDAGAGEVFVEALRLEAGADGAPSVAVLPGLAAPRRLPATLVVTGSWPQIGEDSDRRKAAAKSLGDGLRAAALAAESAGLVPVGFHFAPRLPAGEGVLAGYAEVLRQLRRQLDSRLYLSANLDRRRLGDPDARRLADAVDFLVVFLYGQRPNEGEDPSAWDLASVERAARAAEALGRDFWVGAVTLGRATVLDGSGAAVGTASRTTLGRLVADPALTLDRSRVLDTGTRQVEMFDAGRTTRLGEQRVTSGEKVRVVRVGPGDLLALSQRLAGLKLAHCRGELYYRLPTPEEGLSLPAGVLADVVAGTPPVPGLVVEVAEVRGSGGGRRRLAVTVSNRGELPTGVALLSSNYVELKVSGGAFGAVEPGGFRRYSLRSGGREAASMRDLRDADTVRLFTPELDAGASVTSGAIEVQATGPASPELTAGGEFVLAGGDLYDLPPAPVQLP